MKRGKHTPGPWHTTSSPTGTPTISIFIGESGYKSKITLATCDFSHIRSAFALSPNNEDEKTAKSLGLEFDYNAEAANAKLIAAAPLLLRACQLLVESNNKNRPNHTDFNTDELVAHRAAIIAIQEAT